MWDIAYAQAARGLTGPQPDDDDITVHFDLRHHVFPGHSPAAKRRERSSGNAQQTQKNDEVMTSGGIYGKVMALADNVVTLEVAPNVRIRVHRPQISAVVTGEKSSSKEVKE